MDPTEPTPKWKDVMTGVQIPSSKVVQFNIGGSNIYNNTFNSNRRYRFCPSGNVDCGRYGYYEIKTKLILKHTDANGHDTFEICENQNSTEVGYLDQASDVAEDPNYIFTFTPLPVKNVLNVSCSTLNNFNALIYDSKSNLISSYKNLNNNSSIDLSSLIKGVYFIQILDKGITFKVKKFTKE